MEGTVREITYRDALELPEPVFIDVRAPVEFALDHIPGSINVPLFDDAERALIGTMYREQGKEPALIQGARIAGTRLSDFVRRIVDLKGRDIVITCFRGGMRSTTLASLLCSVGLGVLKLKDGYKGYRRYVRERVEGLEVAPPMFVLHGLTGTGKTGILRRLPNAIDLEGFAGHRSSLFGGMGLERRTQKMFESLLVARIDELREAPFAAIEGESRKIGDIHLPSRMLERMRSSPAILVTASMERRVEMLLKEYAPSAGTGEVEAILGVLAPRVGRKNAAALRELYGRGDLGGFTAMLLEKYYDPLYGHSLEAMEFIARVENNDPAEAARLVKAAIERHLAAGGG